MTLKQKTKLAAFILTGLGIACIAIGLSSCTTSLSLGPTGPQGPTGPTGDTGASCTTVPVSASSIPDRVDQYGGALITCGDTQTFISNGAPGEVGQTGETGTTGSNGSNGTNGTNGTNGVNGSTGNTGSQGASGSTGSQGVQGTTGNTGNRGVMGNTGSQGQAGTSVTTVEFCKQGPTIYPSHFPEYGLCISSNIYAVYYDKQNAWLAEIVPGHYQSTSTGLQCTFNVLANCRIEN